MVLSSEWHNERSTLKLWHEPFGSSPMRRAEVRVSRFLLLRENHAKKQVLEEAHIFSRRVVMLASHSPHLSTPVTTQAQPCGSESVIEHDSFGYSRVSRDVTTVPRIFLPPSSYLVSPIIALTTP
jgi:hypothetical protein